MKNKTKTTMEILKKALRHYFIGVLYAVSIIILIILFDYFFNGYFQYPELSNFINVSLLSGLGFGLSSFAFNKAENKNYQSLIINFNDDQENIIVNIDVNNLGIEMEHSKIIINIKK